jgi:hypothetical protein
MVQSASAPSAGIDFNEFNGVLVYIEVNGLKPQVPTMHGPADAIEANIYAIDGPTPGRAEHDVLIFKKVLVGQLKSHIGSALTGRIGQGAAQPGKNPPWILVPATDAELAQANAFEQQLVAQRGPATVAPPQPQPQAAAPSYPAPGQQPAAYPQPQQGQAPAWPQPAPAAAATGEAPRY